MHGLKAVLLTFIISFSVAAEAISGETEFSQVKEIKAFSTYLSVYLKGVGSDCDVSRFEVDIEQAHFVSFLLTAYASGKDVSVKYTCVDTGAQQKTASVTAVILSNEL